MAAFFNRRGHGQRHACGADGAGDKATAARALLLHFKASFLCKSSAGLVELVNDFLQAIVLLRDGCAVECIGLNKVGSRQKISFVNAVNDVGASDAEQIVVALQFVRMILESIATKLFISQFLLLDFSAHSAINNHNSLGGRAPDVILRAL
jgi:hypothetical protein